MLPKPQPRMPYINVTSGVTLHGAPNRVATSASDLHLHGIWPGMFVVASTNGYVAVKGGETVTGNSTTFASADYFVQKIYDSNMQELTVQYVTSTALNTASAVYYLDVIPLGNLEVIITEDGDTTPITDALRGAITPTYIGAIISEPSAGSGYALYDQQVGGYFYVDSSTVTTATNVTGSLSFQLLGLAPFMQAAYSATAGSQRAFRAKVRTAAVSQ